MHSNLFKLAADRAIRAAGQERWNSLSMAEQSDVIFGELRLMDMELAHGRLKPESVLVPPADSDPVPNRAEVFLHSVLSHG